MTNSLLNLHWLCIPQRIQFKVAVLVHKVLHGLAPQYLRPLTHVSNLPGRRALHPASTNQLDIPFVRLSFNVAGPRYWYSVVQAGNLKYS